MQTNIDSGGFDTINGTIYVAGTNGGSINEPSAGGPLHGITIVDFGYFYAMPYGGQLIWGVTAGMLRILYERLYGAPDPVAALRQIRSAGESVLS